MNWLKRHQLLVVGIAAILMSAAVVAAPADAARPKTDVVVLTNGDKFTGEVKSLAKGRLSFDTSGAGIISIKWNRVAELTSSFVYDVETETGERLLGTLSPGAKGSLVVTSTTGAQRTLAVQSIVGLDPVRRSFWDRLDGAIDLGGSVTQSSGVAQLYVNFWTSVRRPAFEWRATFDDYLTFKTEGATTEQLTASFAYSRYLSGRWALFGQVQAERNPDLGFNVRGTLVGGLQRTLLRSNRQESALGFGLGASREESVDGEVEAQLPAVLAFRYSLFIHDTPKTTLDTLFAAYPILDELPRWRLRVDSSAKREIFKDFSVGLTLYESFDSRPPSAGASRNDVGATISLGYGF